MKSLIACLALVLASASSPSHADTASGVSALSPTSIGHLAEVQPGLKATVTEYVRVDRDNMGPSLTYFVLIKNTSGRKIHVPKIGLRCANSSSTGRNFTSSPYRADRKVPGGQEYADALHSLLPGEDRFDHSVPRCATPAYIQIRPVDSAGHAGKSTVWVRVPDHLVKKMTSTRVR